MGIRIQPRDIDVPRDDPFRNDLLDRREAVETLTHLVGNIDGNCVLSVDAEWGFGKSTFLRMWTRHLRNHGFSVIEFNAWETDFSEEPFVTLATELMEGLQSGETKLPGEMIDKLKKASWEVPRWVVPSAIRLVTSLIPVGGAEIGRVAASVAEDRLSQHSKARNSINGFRSIFRDVTTTLSEANGNFPLIVAIDELDRCRPSYAVELLEVTKHLFAVDHVVFVLVVNGEQLAHSVKALYGNDFDADGYLRRFFDVDFILPEPPRDAFIRALLQATGIDDYFDCTPASKSTFAHIYFRKEVEREKSGEKLQAMLLMFFGASDLSLRSVAQAIHRLGLLYASLGADQDDFGLATTVALILRTLDRKIYCRFVNGKASDREVVDTIFERPNLKNLRQEEWSIAFEAVVILAGLEDEISSMSGSDTVRSPLLDWYRGHEKSKHAKNVVSMVERAIDNREAEIGFSQAVRRLELFSATLIDKRLRAQDSDS